MLPTLACMLPRAVGATGWKNSLELRSQPSRKVRSHNSSSWATASPAAESHDPWGRLCAADHTITAEHETADRVHLETWWNNSKAARQTGMVRNWTRRSG